MNHSEKPEKPAQEKSCNCRNSKCMKLYCECFSAGQECTKSCRCTDCHNQKDGQNFKLFKGQSGIPASKSLSLEGVKISKGCSCRKSFCVKKYCECFQEGLLCNQNCKCIECQNNESMTNRNVLLNLKKNASSSSNKHCSLYPIVLSQSFQQINSLINEENVLGIEDKSMQEEIFEMGKLAEEGAVQPLLDYFINILKTIDSKNSKNQKHEFLKREPQEQ